MLCSHRSRFHKIPSVACAQHYLVVVIATIRWQWQVHPVGMLLYTMILSWRIILNASTQLMLLDDNVMISALELILIRNRIVVIGAGHQ